DVDHSVSRRRKRRILELHVGLSRSFFSLKRVYEIYIVNYPGNHTFGDSWQRSTAGGEPLAGDCDGQAALRREPQVHRHFRAARGVVRTIRFRELGGGPDRP